MIKRELFFGGMLVAALLACTSAASSQELIRDKAQSLAGTTHMEMPQLGGAKGVLVEDCTPDWRNVRAYTTTDEHGYFRFPGHPKQGLHYLRFSGYGVKIQLVKVRIGQQGPRLLSIILHGAN